MREHDPELMGAHKPKPPARWTLPAAALAMGTPKRRTPAALAFDRIVREVRHGTH